VEVTDLKGPTCWRCDDTLDVYGAERYGPWACPACKHRKDRCDKVRDIIEERRAFRPPPKYGGTKRTGLPIEVVLSDDISGFTPLGPAYEPKPKPDEDEDEYEEQWARLCRENKTGSLCLIWSVVEVRRIGEK
jgi:hypothetical protein